jgi:hypothetical protein
MTMKMPASEIWRRIVLYKFTYATRSHIPEEGSSCDQEFCPCYGTWMLYLVQNNPSLYYILNQLNPVHFLALFHVMLPLNWWFPNVLLRVSSRLNDLLYFFLVPAPAVIGLLRSQFNLTLRQSMGILGWSVQHKADVCVDWVPEHNK